MYDAERHQRVREAFHRILKVDAPERGAVLSEVCRRAPELREELESLLRYADDGEALDDAVDSLRSSWSPETPAAAPASIGRFRIVRPIGIGGTGVVYLAEQDHPRRTVAVKVLGHAPGGERHRRRFAQESEILGRLDHPGIARVLEAGCEDGRPYLAMEFVDGRPLDVFAREAGLDRIARVRLLVELCDAVAHAHQRGVVHRDLKPANILVTGDGRVRVLDFGIARVSGLSDLESMQTHAGELMGTLPYMSREQLEGSPDVDVRADVYAIGVIAYELLGGRRPFETPDAPLHAAIRRVLETEPPTLAAVEPACTGDLDIIVGKAMRPACGDRYANVVELAADLRRFLDHEPITARPPSTIYQLRKFAERNRGLVVAGVLGVLMLLATIGIVGAALLETTNQRNAAFNARADADRERDEARRAGDATRRQRDAYLSVIAFSELDRARTEALARSLADEGELDAILAHAFTARGFFVDARTHALRAIARHDATGDGDLERLYELLWISIRVDDSAHYSPRLARWRAANAAMLEKRHPGIAHELAALEAIGPDSWSREYEADDARPIIARIVALTEELPDDDLVVQLAADRLQSISRTFSSLLSPKMARRIIDAAQVMRRRHLLETSPRVLWGRVALVEILLRGREPEAAERTARRAIDELALVLPDDHLLLAQLRAQLGRAVARQGRPAEAVPLLQEAVVHMNAGAGPGSVDRIDALGVLIGAMKAGPPTDDLADATRSFAEAVAASTHRIWWHRWRGRMAPDLDELHAAAMRAWETRKPTSVAKNFDAFFALQRATVPEDDRMAFALAGTTRCWIDHWLLAGGSTLHSRPIHREVERVARRPGAHPLLLAETCAHGVEHASRAGDLAAAEAYFEDGMAAAATGDGDYEWAVVRLLIAWGETLVQHGRPRDALPVIQRAFEMSRRRHGPVNLQTQIAVEIESLARHAIDAADARIRDVASLHAARAERPPRARVLATAAWNVARVDGRDAAAYAAAQGASDTAFEIMPDTWRLRRMRAMTLYRSGQYEEAISVARSVRRPLLGDRPELWAIEAMAHARLGSPEAAAALERAERMLAEDEFRYDVVARDLVAEARRVVAR